MTLQSFRFAQDTVLKVKKKNKENFLEIVLVTTVTVFNIFKSVYNV